MTSEILIGSLLSSLATRQYMAYVSNCAMLEKEISAIAKVTLYEVRRIADKKYAACNELVSYYDVLEWIKSQLLHGNDFYSLVI